MNKNENNEKISTECQDQRSQPSLGTLRKSGEIVKPNNMGIRADCQHSDQLPLPTMKITMLERTKQTQNHNLQDKTLRHITHKNM